ncbi:hypothetical protein ACNHUS_18295 [Actinomycetes bacterium M1A6_2h]
MGMYETTELHTIEKTTAQRVASWIALPMMLASLIALGLFLTAAAGGFEGWSLISGISFVVLLVGGSTLAYRNRAVARTD